MEPQPHTSTRTTSAPKTSTPATSASTTSKTPPTAHKPHRSPTPSPWYEDAAMMLIGFVGMLIAAVGGLWRLLVGAAIVIGVGFGLYSWFQGVTLNEHSSCNQYAQADSSTQSNVLQSMMQAHHDNTNTMLAQASLNAYCALGGNGSQPIDGVYGGSQ